MNKTLYMFTPPSVTTTWWGEQVLSVSIGKWKHQDNTYDIDSHTVCDLVILNPIEYKNTNSDGMELVCQGRFERFTTVSLEHVVSSSVVSWSYGVNRIQDKPILLVFEKVIWWIHINTKGMWSFELCGNDDDTINVNFMFADEQDAIHCKLRW